MERKRIDISSFRIDQTIWPRVSLDRVWVATLKNAILSGARLPPIIVATVEGVENTVIDGVHRICAYNLLGIRKVEKEDLGSLARDEALATAVMLNTQHGKPLTPLERIRAAWRLENEFKWSRDRVSKVVRLPPETIKRNFERRVVRLYEKATTSLQKPQTLSATDFIRNPPPPPPLDDGVVVLKEPIARGKPAVVESEQQPIIGGSPEQVARSLIAILKTAWPNVATPTFKKLLKELLELLEQIKPELD